MTVRFHYLARDPLWALPLAALVVNIMVIGFLVVQVRSGSSRMRITVAEPHRSTAWTSASVSPPVLAVAADGRIALEGEPLVTPLDLEFRLSALADRGTAIILRTDPKLDAATMAHVLQACSEAGFSDLLVEVAKAPH